MGSSIFAAIVSIKKASPTQGKRDRSLEGQLTAKSGQLAIVLNDVNTGPIQNETELTKVPVSSARDFVKKCAHVIS